jgi:peptide/nickel transport system substrate-binding protein
LRVLPTGALMAGLLASCAAPSAPGQTEGPRVSTSSEPTPAARTGQAHNGGTLKAFFATQDPPTLDPYINSSFRGQTFAAFVYSRLLMSKKAPGIAANAYEMDGDLAESWQHSPDGLTYTFNLRRDAAWHNLPPMNGRPVSAADVAWSFEHFMQVSPQKSTFDMVADVSAPDDHTLVFRLNSVYAPFETLLGAPIFWILPKEVVERDGDASQHPVGSGPFVFDRFDPGVSIHVQKNASYYRAGEPHVDDAFLHIIPDVATQLAGLRAGELDYAPVDQQNVASIRSSNPAIQMVEWEYLLWPFVYWKIDQPPFNDIRVRQAVSMALSRDDTINIIFGGRGNWNNAVPWAITDWWLDPRSAAMGPNGRYFNYDLGSARQLLAAAGYPNGLEVELVSTTGYGDVFVQAVELLQRDLAALGITATLKMQEYADYVSSTFQGKFDGGNRLAFGLISPPAEPYLHLFNVYHPRGLRNSAGVNDPKLTAMIEQLPRVLDAEQRKQQVFEVQRYLAEQAYYVPHVAGMVTAGLSPRVRNFFPISDFGFGAEIAPKLWLDV